MNEIKEQLLKDKQNLFCWMDANDAHMSLWAVEELRKINQQLTEI
jgi:hypothetical protein|tara:strand:+ start:436 stop:570 length:135 start_codon:yes stop_codon:yes gene_type:complete